MYSDINQQLARAQREELYRRAAEERRVHELVRATRGTRSDRSDRAEAGSARRQVRPESGTGVVGHWWVRHPRRASVPGYR
jgi:hypothetical protein